MPIRCLALDVVDRTDQLGMNRIRQLDFKSSWSPGLSPGAPGAPAPAGARGAPGAPAPAGARRCRLVRRCAVKPRAAAARGGLRGERQRAWCRISSILRRANLETVKASAKMSTKRLL